MNEARRFPLAFPLLLWVFAQFFSVEAESRLKWAAGPAMPQQCLTTLSDRATRVWWPGVPRQPFRIFCVSGMCSISTTACPRYLLPYNEPNRSFCLPLRSTEGRSASPEDDVRWTCYHYPVSSIHSCFGRSPYTDTTSSTSTRDPPARLLPFQLIKK